MSTSPDHVNGIWDTHVHLLDPVRFQYRPDRAYTPYPALPEELLESSTAKNFLVVQASIEDGYAGISEHLKELQRDHPGRIFRCAIILESNESSQSLDLEQLQEAGVRCLRFRTPGEHRDALVETVKMHLTGGVGQTARRQGWAVSMQLPLRTWAALVDYLEHENPGISIIAEHCAGLRVPLTEEDKLAFEVVLELLRSKNIYVKLGALHRRILSGASIAFMEQHIRKMAEAGPEQLLWGSDWPHVDASSTGLTPSPHLAIDACKELEQLCAWLPADVVQSMLYATPNKLFEA